MSSEQSTKFNDALNSYYKLKTQYKSITEQRVSKLIKNETLTKKEKQQKFKQLKNKCIICGNDGGTIFTQNDNVLIAKCGNQEKPCILDIQLQKAKYINITNLIEEINKKININTASTIRTKLNFLFGFSSEAITLEEFNKLKTELIFQVQIYKKIIEQYQNIILNISNNKEIIQQNHELFILTQSLNDLIKQFEETKNITLLKDAVELYLHNIKELAEKIRNLKYAYSSIEYNENDNTHTLIQEQYTQSQMYIPKDNVKNKILVFKK